jgi:hypothetical protein
MRQTKTSVLALHHPGKNIKRGERGSSAWRGNVDYSIAVHEEKGTFSLTFPKARSSAKIAGIKYRLQQVKVSNETNCVIAPLVLTADAESEKSLLACLPVAGARFAEWFDLSGLPRSTFRWARQRLQDKGLIQASGGVYFRSRQTPK